MVTDYTKQSELIIPYEFNKPIHIIGCGAIGSWVAIMLLKMGFENITVWDFDTVEEHNIPNQAFSENDINKEKTEAMMNLYKYMFDEEAPRVVVRNKAVDETNAHALRGIIFCCVDSMEARKTIYEGCYKYGQAEMWIEGRIGLFGAYIYTLHDKNNEVFKKYEDTLYADEEAEVSVCGVSQTALPAAVNCASLMIMQMISYHRETNIQNVLQYQIPDLLSFNATW